jgi:tetratricopeptide (TPR) repeat protein
MKTLFTALVFLVFTLQLHADGGGGSSSSADPLPDNIPALVDSGQYQKAIIALEDFISDEKKNPDAWNYLGYSQRNVGLLDESLKSYKKALKLDRKHLGANEYIGELYLMLNDPKKAKKHLKRLSKYCGDCEQYQDLDQAINKYEQGS